MLLPSLYNLARIQRAKEDEDFHIVVHASPAPQLDISEAIQKNYDSLKDGQVYFLKLIYPGTDEEYNGFYLLVNTYKGQKFIHPIGNEYTFRDEMFGIIPKNQYELFKTLAPFKNEDDDSFLATLLFGMDVPISKGTQIISPNISSEKRWQQNLFNSSDFLNLNFGSWDYLWEDHIKIEEFFDRIAKEVGAEKKKGITTEKPSKITSSDRYQVPVYVYERAGKVITITSEEHPYQDDRGEWKTGQHGTISGDLELSSDFTIELRKAEFWVGYLPDIDIPKIKNHNLYITPFNKDIFDNNFKLMVEAKGLAKPEFAATEKEKEIMERAVTEAKPIKKTKFDEEQEKLLKEALAESESSEKKKTDTKKAAEKAASDKKVDDIFTPKEVSSKEVAEASEAAEKATTPAEVVLKKKKKIDSKVIIESLKEKDKVSATAVSKTVVPDDAYKIYSLAECSEMYNESIKRDEFEAYFYAHPELAHIRKEILGEDILHTKEELIDAGLLVYDPVKDKLVYKYEYLKGNAYELEDALKAAQEKVVLEYGSDMYEKQLALIDGAKPALYELSGAKIPFIHPLDENIVGYIMKQTKSIYFAETAADKDKKKAKARKFVEVEEEEAEEGEESESGLSAEEELLAKEAEVLGTYSLPIIIFFKKWLESQKFRLADFRLESYKEVEAIYFGGIGYNAFVQFYHREIHPKTKEDEPDITEIQYAEKRDNCKRFVDNLYQEFLKDEILEEDKKAIERIWNTSYNGTIRPFIKKIPIFMRHSKYVKNYEKMRLRSVQSDGVRFAALYNSCILALDAGYGKTLSALGFISHLFETGQATNILTMIPKALYDNKKWAEEAVGKTDEDGRHLIDPIDKKYKVGAFPLYNLIQVSNLTEGFVRYGDKVSPPIKMYSDSEEEKISYYERVAKFLTDEEKYHPTSYGNPPKNWKRVLSDLEEKDKELYWRFSDKQVESLIDIVTDAVSELGKPDAGFFKYLAEKLVERKLNHFYLETFGKPRPTREEVKDMPEKDFQAHRTAMKTFIEDEIDAFEKKAKQLAFRKYWQKKHKGIKFKRTDPKHIEERDKFYDDFELLSGGTTAEFKKKRKELLGEQKELKKALVELRREEKDLKKVAKAKTHTKADEDALVEKTKQITDTEAKIAEIDKSFAELVKAEREAEIGVAKSVGVTGAGADEKLKKTEEEKDYESRTVVYGGMTSFHPLVAELYCQHTLEELYKYTIKISEKMRGYAIYTYGDFTFKKTDKNIILATNVAIASIGFEKNQLESITETVREIMYYQHETEEKKSISDKISERIKGVTEGRGFGATKGVGDIYMTESEVEREKLRLPGAGVVGATYEMNIADKKGNKKIIGKITDKSKAGYTIEAVYPTDLAYLGLDKEKPFAEVELVRQVKSVDWAIEDLKRAEAKAAEEAAYAVDVIDVTVTGERASKPFETTASKTLQKQLQIVMEKLIKLVTEDASQPKFMLSQLGIDGFILDEAHQAKKIFTSVKTDNSIWLKNPKEEKFIRIPTTNYDIHGGSPPSRALRIFGICSYVHSIKKSDGVDKNSPVMLLSATPFTNQPTEVFSMLTLVGMKVLKFEGIHNIKNFFDLFLKETMKYDFDHKGNFVKKVVIEDFRNKDKLNNLIWSLVNIRRGSEFDDIKPKKMVIPLFPKTAFEEKKDMPGGATGTGIFGLKELAELERITTTAIKRTEPVTSSILDMNKEQLKMQEDLDRYLINPSVSFESICPNFKLYQEIVKEAGELDEEEDKTTVTEESEELAESAAEEATAVEGALVEDSTAEEEKAELKEEDLAEYEGKIDRKTLESIKKFIRAARSESDYGRVFRALGAAKAICMSPYLFRCNDLPIPTPENLVKYSPKIEYLAKCLKSVRDWHTKKGEVTSGQLIYMNLMRFRYLNPETKEEKEYNIPQLLAQYLWDKGWFEENEVAILTGSQGRIGTRNASREEIVKQYNNGDVKVLFGSPAIREGVDLQTKSSVLYIMTPDWNPTDMRQVEGRVWRQGNENANVRIVYVLMDNSVEIFIYAKLEEKARRLEKLMKESNAPVELEEMSVDPDQIKVALASDPQKRSDIIIKKAEMTIAEELSRIIRDEDVVAKLAAKATSAKEKVGDVRDLFARYTRLKAETTEKFNKYKKEGIELDKAKWAKNPDILLVEAGYAIKDNEDGSKKYLWTDEEVKKYFDEKVAKISEWGINTYKDKAQQEVGANFKHRNGTELISKKSYVEHFSYEQIVIMYVLWDLITVRSRIISDARVIEDDERFVPDMLPDTFLGRAMELYKKKRDEFIKVVSEREVKFRLTESTVAPYKAEVMTKFDELPLMSQVKKIVDMKWDLYRLKADYANASADLKAQMTEGTNERPYLAETFARIRTMYSPEVQGSVNQLDEFFENFRFINSAYLEPRGMKLEDAPKLSVEISEKRYQFERALSSLKTKKEELIERFKKERETKETFSVDKIVSAFNRTNSLLDDKLPVKK